MVERQIKILLVGMGVKLCEYEREFSRIRMIGCKIV